MSNETNIIPLVDILSDQLGERVVMDGDGYVHLDDKEVVPQSEVDIALAEQNKLRLESEAQGRVDDAKLNILKTNTAMTEDMYVLMSPDEQTAMKSFRTDNLTTISSGGTHGQSRRPASPALISAFARFGIK